MKNIIRFALCVLIAGSGVVFAAERGKAGAIDIGVAVSKEIADDDGNVIRITAIPPANRAVDPAILQGWEIAREGIGKDEVLIGEKGAKKNSPPERRIDVSGYQIVIEAIRLKPADTCTASVRAAKAAPFSLGPGKQFQVSSTSPEHMNAAAFPTSGDVDVQVQFNGTACSNGNLGPGRLDRAGCTVTDCSTTGTFKTRIYNASSVNPAKFVAAVGQVFISPF